MAPAGCGAAEHKAHDRGNENPSCSFCKESEVRRMGHPVTTNPFIIMLINMAIVFAVLMGLSAMIRLIHIADPTKESK